MSDVDPVRGGAIALPPLAEVAAALRKVTEALAHEITATTDQPPSWGDFEWRVARAVASMQGVSSILSTCLKWKAPMDWMLFLQEQQNHVAGRHRKIEELVHGIDSRARRAGISLLALKGAALHAIKLYRSGERPMADIDVLARESDVEAATRVFEDCGFELTFTTWRNSVFESRLRRVSTAGDFGENTNFPIKIELHTGIRERLPISEIDITPFLFAGSPDVGLTAYPSIASLMMHLLLHAAGNMRSRALRLIQLHDIALLAARLTRSDWDELLGARPSGQTLWWALPPLSLTARYYPRAIPAFVMIRLEAECQWLLRKTSRGQTLTDVSWSNIDIAALPGIEWSRTPREALRFVSRRIWPSRDDRLELQHFAADHPGASEVPWYGISQSGRILRWVFSRPPRVQTLLSVRAALDHPG